MLAIERRNEILSKLREEKKVLVGDLSKYYKVTEETIRRDLDLLEQKGLAKKTYGGAVLVDDLKEDLPYNIRKQTNIKEKKEIAELVSDMIQDGEHIMIDASSTALYIAKSIRDKENITIITNSLEVMFELSDKRGWRILSTGGVMKEGALALIGPQTAKMIDNFHVDKAIISCKGIDRNIGITDSNEADVEIKKHMIKSAKEVILVVDSGKFDKISFVRMEDFSNIDYIVTDSNPSDEWHDTLERNGVKLIIN
ncbi:DeoR/GlpR family DNA-binding transcription regulator [Clostridium tertium]|jgi:DeoR/GlpR family transcriptional regulator of sugar metabolism|uniref:DeoR/GlpR family DNA-binding transcription regulator n=1 Tax=Clostridium TaxID=1485 RepID=UPI001157FF1D|nr:MULTISPECIES: DeoR/GlpR family DNA-binding transcription regulator [Clostridium]MBS5305897.1 DeoR/GlpR transcriptional regulator [Clostridium sp.]MDB1920995.1 DeoR/GlpR family DNA-binding transcription regulator [Clostridium tertium]MDB1925525.1 DeoR/GlpR family DNA-binding transcription regulator [Clostridium tertium]MDB1928608.1 DeoR/GlpR family DNA-binding transcription regulator [Clostridium tertium]MDB1943597.1 DeoR/GlpR family DNA-binding transcription regulator [Clostridium tertium]